MSDRLSSIACVSGAIGMDCANLGIPVPNTSPPPPPPSPPALVGNGKNIQG